MRKPDYIKNIFAFFHNVEADLAEILPPGFHSI